MITHQEFLRKYSKDLLDSHAAVFVGAGMSIPVGFVNWKDLLREIAEDMGLDIELENDLVAVAQYEVNRKRTRDSLDQAIIQEFSKQATLSENHKLLSRLPIDTVWTTNYDQILEQSFKEANRRVDVKHRPEHLRSRNPYADVTLFKMHGDVGDPGNAVLTKDDYECYEVEREAFTVQLLSDLLSKRFLFLGFSFTDPNLEYTFNRLRRILNPNRKGVTQTKEHYCILKKPVIEDYDLAKYGGDKDKQQKAFTLDKKRFEYRVEDLKNYGIQTVAIEKYEEVGMLLDDLNRRVKTRSIMISGAAETFAPMGEDKIDNFCRTLARRLIEQDYDIISGVGKGISGSIMIGAHEALSRPNMGRIGQRLRLFPFPYWMPDSPKRNEYYEANRREMASQGGIAIVIAGNKLDPHTGKIINSPGVATEVKLAKDAKQYVIPVGVSGHAAKELWDAASSDPKEWFFGIDAGTELAKLGDETLSSDQLVDAVFELISKIRNQKS